jgi:predicted enzyme related to lactoylglutathione lyase
MVGDAATAIAFYRDVLGMNPTVENAQGAEFTLGDGSTFGVYQPEDTSFKGGSVMFAVEDARSAVERFRERGAKLSDPMETPVCFMSFGEDPEGNGFCIHQRKVKD